MNQHISTPDSSPMTCAAELLVYTSRSCPHCVRLKHKLRRTGLVWHEIDIENDSAAADYVRGVNNGNQTVPTVVFSDGTIATNPSLEQVLAIAAQARCHSSSVNDVGGQQMYPSDLCVTNSTFVDDLATMLLPWVMRLTAAGHLVVWTLVLALSATGTVHKVPHWLFRMTVWGSHSADAVQVMLACVYLAWAVFLWIAARNPAGNRLFIDFSIAANLAHFGGMGVMAVYMHGEHHHMYGDVLAGLLAVAPLAAVWLPVRRHLPPGLSAQPALTIQPNERKT